MPAILARPIAQKIRISAFIATASAQDTAKAASTQWRAVADQIRPKVPKLATIMNEAEHDVLAYISFPQEHRAKLHSSHQVERLIGEIKRPAEVAGPRAISRIDGVRALEQNDDWTVQRAPLHDAGNHRGDGRRCRHQLARHGILFKQAHTEHHGDDQYKIHHTTGQDHAPKPAVIMRLSSLPARLKNCAVKREMLRVLVAREIRRRCVEQGRAFPPTPASASAAGKQKKLPVFFSACREICRDKMARPSRRYHVFIETHEFRHRSRHSPMSCTRVHNRPRRSEPAIRQPHRAPWHESPHVDRPQFISSAHSARPTARHSGTSRAARAHGRGFPTTAHDSQPPRRPAGSESGHPRTVPASQYPATFSERFNCRAARCRA